MGVNASTRRLLEMEKAVQAGIVEGHLIGLRKRKEEHQAIIKKIDDEIIEYEKRAKNIWDGNDKIMDEQK